MPRELIDTGNDKRFVRRDEQGHPQPQKREHPGVGRGGAGPIVALTSLE